MRHAWKLTPRALEDLDAIADYTLEKWDIERPDIHPGYRSFPVGSHVVFYVDDGNFINIIGIPHKSMDVGSFFL